MRTPRSVTLVLMMAAASACSPRRPVAPAIATGPGPATAASPAAMATPAPVAPAPAADLFQAQVKPLLFAKCSPCHAPGGTMYARMPFDDPATVREHQAGILRRLKADGVPLERWLAAPP